MCFLYSEINDFSSGLLIEVWTKGIIWDRGLGYHFIPLHEIPYKPEQTFEQWYSLDTELILMDGEVTGTKNATGHMILLDFRFEVPFDEDTQSGDLQRKLELLNGIMSHEPRHHYVDNCNNKLFFY